MTDVTIAATRRGGWTRGLKASEIEWTEDRTETLKRMWASGFSQNEIASELGLHSRGAVSGKIARLGLSRPTERRPTREITLARKVHALQSMPKGRLELTELCDGVCRWPSGDGPFLFCGDASIAGRPYCLNHAILAYPSL